jgi:hypothetical protein
MRLLVQAVILGVGMTAAMMTVALQSGTAGDLVSWAYGGCVNEVLRYPSPVCSDLTIRGVNVFILLMQVLVQGMLAQLWAPLVSVGGLYRRLRKVDCDADFCLATCSCTAENMAIDRLDGHWADVWHFRQVHDRRALDQGHVAELYSSQPRFGVHCCSPSWILKTSFRCCGSAHSLRRAA